MLVPDIVIICTDSKNFHKKIAAKFSYFEIANVMGGVSSTQHSSKVGLNTAQQFQNGFIICLKNSLERWVT